MPDGPKNKPTRGSGLLERILARLRSNKANKLIPRQSRSGTILDIGCGSYPLFLMETRFAEKYGLDRLALKSPPTEPARTGINLVDHDLELNPHLPFPDARFDVVSMLAVFEHIALDRLPTVLGEIHRVLKPGGAFVLTIPAGWIDPLLKLMARLGMVSLEEVYEHKDKYNLRKVLARLGEAGFERKRVEAGYFELFMNMWARAVK